MLLPNQLLVPKTFSSYFGVSRSDVDTYGAIDISLQYDLPLFIDPFLLFNSTDEELQQIHKEMIRYVVFLRDEVMARASSIPQGMLDAWFMFPEVKQTWLGFSKTGNSGRGLGHDFAKSMSDNLATVFSDFGSEQELLSPHFEKLCLINPKVGKDKISDFTTNFAKEYLIRYTQAFASQNIDPSFIREFTISKIWFNYDTKSWVSGTYLLPEYNGDYVLLTPRSILTKDNTFINYTDMTENLQRIALSIGNEALRFELNSYLASVLKDGKLTKDDRRKKASEFIKAHPEIINSYLQFKEQHEDEATTLSDRDVQYVTDILIEGTSQLKSYLAAETDFYSERATSYQVALRKAHYLKHCIEDCDLYKILWYQGQAVGKEETVQLLFRLCWEFDAGLDVNREPNNGRGPVDYKISRGSSDKSLVEFKLARNSKLRQNLQNQVDVYKAANDADKAVIIIVFYTKKEQEKLEQVLTDLGMHGLESIVIIDARCDNKPSASNA